MKILLLNTTIATAYPATYHLSAPLTTEQARELIAGHETDSAIGHEATAQAMSTLLDRPVAVNRTQAVQAVGQTALVLKLRGRLAEGKILTLSELEAIGFDLLTMTRVG